MRFVKFSDDTGSVLIEVIGFGLLLQVPILFFGLALVSLQHDKLAAQAIARDVMRSFMMLDRAPEATALSVADTYRVDRSRLSVELNCYPSDCEAPGTSLSLRVRVGSIAETLVARR